MSIGFYKKNKIIFQSFSVRWYHWNYIF